MSNLEKSSRLLQDWADMHSVDMDMYHGARKLLEAGLLAPDVQIVRSLEELEEFDKETVFMNIWSDLFDVSNVHAGMNREDFPYYFPCAVVASGDQVRAAREAMEKDND